MYLAAGFRQFAEQRLKQGIIGGIMFKKAKPINTLQTPVDNGRKMWLLCGKSNITKKAEIKEEEFAFFTKTKLIYKIYKINFN